MESPKTNPILQSPKNQSSILTLTPSSAEEKVSDQYGTPHDLFLYLDNRFHFNLDPCTTADNPLCTPVFYTYKDYSLSRPWEGPVFMNPPYSRVLPWVQKAEKESNQGQLVVGLLRNDPSTQWWQNHVKGKALVVDIPYPIIFRDPDKDTTNYRAYNFPSAIVIWIGDLSGYKPGSETG